VGIPAVITAGCRNFAGFTDLFSGFVGTSQELSIVVRFEVAIEHPTPSANTPAYLKETSPG